MLVRGAMIMAGFSAWTLAASAQTVAPGNYLCTVEQRAGVGGNHLEGSGPPTAFVDEAPRLKFRIGITQGPGFTARELPYDGPEASRYEWQTSNAMLHSAYFGDGYDFSAAEGQAFLRMAAKSDDELWFYHSGFEYAGGEDVSLTVRYGTCELDRRRKP